MDNCVTGTAKQVSQGLPDLEFVTITLAQGNVVASVDRDVLVQFARPHRFFMIGSISGTFAASDVFMHFQKLGYNPVNGSNIITPTGGEPWIPISNAVNSTGRCEGRWIRFTKPVDHFYVDVDHAVTSPNTFKITFIGTDDIEAAVCEQQ